jgi:DNA-binding winged helix-turn-helix (wHTH) protein
VTPDRYRFADFVVSMRQRQLFKNGQPLPLIPRYFDLLILLIERRQAAVSRQEIFDRVWSDVVVSDGALSQAVRTLRRTLGDDSREPLFIRTVSRHGYSFVFADVVAESESVPLQPTIHVPVGASEAASEEDLIEGLIERLLAPTGGRPTEDQRDAAEQLHLLGTEKALARLTRTRGHARGLALMRDARWNVKGAGAVPLLSQPEGYAAARELIRFRLGEALHFAERRWAAAAVGAAAAGALTGVIGGLALVLSPSSRAPLTVIAVLGLLGAIAGAVGASGVAAGIAAAEAIARSRRGIAIVSGGAIGGLAVGLVAHLAVRWTLEGLFGLRLSHIGGPVEGLILGAAAGLGYASTTRRPGGGGMATPLGAARWRTTFSAAVCCAGAGLMLSLAGRPLVGGLINEIAQASLDSHMALTPLSALYEDPSFGLGTKALLAMLESGFFGLGLAFGFTRRPRIDRQAGR